MPSKNERVPSSLLKMRLSISSLQRLVVRGTTATIAGTEAGENWGSQSHSQIPKRHWKKAPDSCKHGLKERLDKGSCTQWWMPIGGWVSLQTFAMWGKVHATLHWPSLRCQDSSIFQLFFTSEKELSSIQQLCRSICRQWVPPNQRLPSVGSDKSRIIMSNSSSEFCSHFFASVNTTLALLSSNDPLWCPLARVVVYIWVSITWQIFLACFDNLLMQDMSAQWTDVIPRRYPP